MPFLGRAAEGKDLVTKRDVRDERWAIGIGAAEGASRVDSTISELDWSAPCSKVTSSAGETEMVIHVGLHGT